MDLYWLESTWFGDLVAALLGAVMGSFLGVVAMRLAEGLSIVSPPSYCRRCGHELSWRDNLPVVGYLLRRGRCRWCGGRYSAEHLWIELFCAALTWVFWARFGVSWELLVGWIFIWMLLAISLIDFAEQIIPDEISLPGIGVGLILAFLPGGVDPPDAGIAVLAAGAGLWLIAAAYARLRGREGLGGGDIKLLAMMGAFLGLRDVVLALLIGSVLGAILGGAALALSRSKRETPIPFGPFLSAGAVLVYMGGDRLWTLYGELLGGLR